MYPILVFAIVFAVGVFGACPTIYWRDASEFILTALFRDVPHQPGSPLYASIAPLWSLLPGPLPWRINLFSVTCGALFCGSLSATIKKYNFKNPVLPLLPLLCLTTDAFRRQLFTAEVYVLYALLALLIIHIAAQAGDRRDPRYLYLFGFLSGIGLGAHVALILPCTAAFFLLAVGQRSKPLLITVLFGFYGLCIFSYLPVRAAAMPPLNSGNITSIGRFFDFVANVRDIKLRPADGLSPSIRERTENFLVRLKGELGIPWLGLGVLGLVPLALQNRRKGLLIGTFFFLNIVPFFSWDPDPWVLAIGLSTVASAAAVNFLERSSKILSNIAIATLLLTSIRPDIFALKDYYGAEKQGEQLAQSDKDSITLLEAGWFLGIATTEIYRVKNANILPTPSLLYPEYFSNPIFQIGEESVNSLAAKTSHPSHSEFAALSALLKGIGKLPDSKNFSLRLQPSTLINRPFKELLIFKDQMPKIIFEQKGELETEFPAHLKQQMSDYRQELIDTPTIARADARNYFESLLYNWADLLQLFPDHSLRLLAYETFCQDPFVEVCSAVSINNYALELVDAGRFAEATKILSEVLSSAGDRRPTIRQNLAFAYSKLQESMVHE